MNGNYFYINKILAHEELIQKFNIDYAKLSKNLKWLKNEKTKKYNLLPEYILLKNGYIRIIIFKLQIGLDVYNIYFLKKQLLSILKIFKDLNINDLQIQICINIKNINSYIICNSIIEMIKYVNLYE